MTVANEMYHLGNISRISTYTELVGFHGSVWRAIWLKKWRIVFVVVAIGALGSSGSSAATFLLLLVLIFAGITVYQIVRMLKRKRTEYILRLESAGVVRGVLASEDADVIEKIVKEVSEAIRNPPVNKIELNFPNAHKFSGTDVYQQGERNVGIQHNT